MPPSVGTHVRAGTGQRVAAQREHVADARVGRATSRIRVSSSVVCPTQVRCAIGSSEVSRAIRPVIAMVRSRVVPPAP